MLHLSKAVLDRILAKLSVFGTRSTKLKVTRYVERQGITCGVNSNGVSRYNPDEWLVLRLDDDTWKPYPLEC
jgi:ligand-binding sensor domain-containing protein